MSFLLQQGKDDTGLVICQWVRHMERGVQLSDGFQCESKPGNGTLVGLCPLWLQGVMQLPQVGEVELFAERRFGAGQWVAAATQALPPSVCASGPDSLKIPSDLHGTTSL